MSKFRAAFEEGMIVRARLETEAVARRRAILENPDPTLLEQAKMWVNSELPGLLKQAALWGEGPVELIAESNDLPSDYLYLVCKDHPELVVSEEQCVYTDYSASVYKMEFVYSVSLRYPLS